MISLWVFQAKLLGRETPLVGTVWARNSEQAADAAYMNIEDGVLLRILVHRTLATTDDESRIGQVEVMDSVLD